MTYQGRVKNGAVVLNEPVTLPEGADVEVSVLEPAAPPADPELPPDVAEVCARRGLGGHLPLAVRLAREAFGPASDLRLSVDTDPDTDDRRVVLDVTVDATVDELLRRHRDYTRRWVQAVPADAGQWV